MGPHERRAEFWAYETAGNVFKADVLRLGLFPSLRWASGAFPCCVPSGAEGKAHWAAFGRMRRRGNVFEADLLSGIVFTSLCASGAFPGCAIPEVGGQLGMRTGQHDCWRLKGRRIVVNCPPRPRPLLHPGSYDIFIPALRSGAFSAAPPQRCRGSRKAHWAVLGV